MIYAGCTTLPWAVTGVGQGDRVLFDTFVPDVSKMTTQLSTVPKCSASQMQGAVGAVDPDLLIISTDGTQGSVHWKAIPLNAYSDYEVAT